MLQNSKHSIQYMETPTNKSHNQYKAYLKSMIAADFKLPSKNILVSFGPMRQKLDFIACARLLVEMGFQLYATKNIWRLSRRRQDLCFALSFSFCPNWERITFSMFRKMCRRSTWHGRSYIRNIDFYRNSRSLWTFSKFLIFFFRFWIDPQGPWAHLGGPWALPVAQK